MSGTSETSLTSDAPSNSESEREALLTGEPSARAPSSGLHSAVESAEGGRSGAQDEGHDDDDGGGKIRNTGPVPLIVDWALMMLVVGLVILAGATKDYVALVIAIVFLIITAALIAGGAVHMAGEQPEGEDDGRGPH